MKIGIASSAFGKSLSVREATEVCREIPLEFLELNPMRHPDLKQFLKVHADGRGELDRSSLELLASEIKPDLELHFHLMDRVVDVNGRHHVWEITSGEPGVSDALLGMAEFLHNSSPRFVIPVHMHYRYGDLLNVPPEEAMKRAEAALDYIGERWQFDGFLALETMMTPESLREEFGGRFALLGSEPEQLERLVRGREQFVAVCIDMGHLNGNLSPAHTFEDFLGLPVAEVHLHGNNGRSDLHQLPTPNNLVDLDALQSFLANFDGSVCLEGVMGSVAQVRDSAALLGLRLPRATRERCAR